MKCNSCHEVVHRSTNICPYCGQKVKKIDAKLVSLIISGIIVLCVFIYFINKPVDKESQRKQEKLKQLTELQVKAETTVKEMLKDPNSVEFKNQLGPCGQFNAKNSFGAYTGFRRYIVFREINALEGVNTTSEEMNSLWQVACKY